MKKPAAADPQAIMHAVAVRNELVKEVGRREASLRLSAPLASGGFRWLFKSGREKAFELDALGMWVWDRVNGRTSVEQLVAAFAKAHGVDAQEAEGRMLGFLKMLLQRNLITLVKK